MKTKTITRKTKVWVSLVLTLVILGSTLAVCFGSGAFAWGSENVFDLYNEAENSWSREEFNKMASRIYLNATEEYADDIDNLVDKMVNGNIPAKNALELLRPQSGEITSDNTDATKEWTVRLGDTEWMPVYLSVEEGQLILTLWQATSTNLSAWNLSYTSNPDIRPRSNMYSTSYIRTVGLNNDGYYYTGYDDDGHSPVPNPMVTPVRYYSDEIHPYALFTHGALAKYIFTPKQMTFQTNRSLYVNDYSNTTVGYEDQTPTELADGAFPTYDTYQSWGEDALWLPTKYEVNTLWQTTTNQKTNNVGSWLRDSATTTANSATAKADRLYGSGAPAQDYVDDATGNAIRPCIHFNLSRAAKKVAKTTGYSRTPVDEAKWQAFQDAWKFAIDNNDGTAEQIAALNAYNSPVVKLSWDPQAFAVNKLVGEFTRLGKTREGAVVFQLLDDWAAKEGGDNGTYFGTGSEYFWRNSAIRVNYGKSIVIDLNGHTINRNLYFTEEDTKADPNNAPGMNYSVKWGNVITVGGVYTGDGGHTPDRLQAQLKIKDSQMDTEFARVDENGLAAVGRITGGRNLGQYWVEQGGGVIFQGECTVIFESGAVCYNDAASRGGGFLGYGTYSYFEMSGGFDSHNITSNKNPGYVTARGGGFFGDKGLSRAYFLGGEMSYNTSLAVISGHEGGVGGAMYLGTGGGVKITLDGLYIHHNKATFGGAFYLNTGGNAVTLESGYMEYNQAYRSYPELAAKSVTLDQTTPTAGFAFVSDGIVTINGGTVRYNSAEGRGGAVFSGGAIDMAGGKVYGNTSGMEGGAFYSRNSVDISGGEIYNNKSQTSNGGAMYIESGVFTMAAGNISKNSAPNGWGGGLYLANGSVNLFGGRFTGNSAAQYPGFFANGVTRIAGSFDITGNLTQDKQEQNIYLANPSATVTVTDSLTSHVGVTKSFNETTNNFQLTTNRNLTGVTYLLSGRDPDTDEDILWSENIGGTTYYAYETETSHTAASDTVTKEHGPISHVRTRVLIATPGIRQTAVDGYVWQVWTKTEGSTTDVIYQNGSWLAKMSANGMMYMHTDINGRQLNLWRNGRGTSYGSMAQIGDSNVRVTWSDVTVYIGGTDEANRYQVYYNAAIARTLPSGQLYGYGYFPNAGSDEFVYFDENTVFGNFEGALTETQWKDTSLTPRQNKTATNFSTDGYTQQLYVLNMDDALAFQCDTDTRTTCFTVLPAVVEGTTLSALYLEPRPRHVHSWEFKGVKETCDTQGFDLWVCTGCQEVYKDSEYGPGSEGGDQRGGKPCKDAGFHAPLGHQYSWDDEKQRFICGREGCTGDTSELFLEWGNVADQLFQGVAFKPQVPWRLYNIVKGEKVYWETYQYFEEQQSEGKTLLSGFIWNRYDGKVEDAVYKLGWNHNEHAEYDLNGGFAIVTLDLHIELFARGIFYEPYGTNAGLPIYSEQAALDDYNAYVQENGLAKVGTTPINFGKGWQVCHKVNGSTFTRFRIRQNTPTIMFNMPSEPAQGWFVTDTELFFSRLAWFAYVDDDRTKIVAEQGDKGENGVLMWYHPAKDGKKDYYSTDTPELIAGEGVRYYWQFVPNPAYKDLQKVEGWFTLNVRELILHDLSAEFDGLPKVFNDYDGWEAIVKRFTINAEFINNYDDQGNPLTTSSVVEWGDDNLSYALIDVATGNKYSVLRAGDAFQIEFTYTYGSVTKTFVTEDAWPISSKNTIKAIRASWTTDDGMAPAAYDSWTSLDKLRDYILVEGADSADALAKDWHAVDSYVLECDAWVELSQVHRMGWAPGLHNVVVSYNGIEAEDPLEVLVLSNSVVSLKVPKSTDEWQRLEVTTTTPLADVPKFGTLVVTAVYADGTEKEIPQSVDNQPGYVISGKITLPVNGVPCKLTISYTEVDLISGETSFALDRIPVQATEFRISAVNYSVKEGLRVLNADTATTLLPKLTVIATMIDGTTTQEVPAKEGDGSSQEMYFDIISTHKTGNDMQIGIGVYRAGVLLAQTIGLEPIYDAAVLSITIETLADATINELMTPEYLRDNYLIITEYWNTGDSAVVWNPSEDICSAEVLGRISLALPSAQNGKLVGGQTNNITVTYEPTSGEMQSEPWRVFVETVDLDSIAVSFKQSPEGEPAYSTTLSNGQIGLRSGLIYLSSTAEDIKKYIDVKGFSAMYPDGVEILNYTVSGIFALPSEREFTITATVSANGGGTKDLTTSVWIYVTNVQLTAVKVAVDQGTMEIYSNTKPNDIRDILTVTACYNDGSEKVIASGFSIKVYTRSGNNPSNYIYTLSSEGFILGKVSYIGVTYATVTGYSATPVEVIQGDINGLDYEVWQRKTPLLYETSAASKFALFLQVVATRSDGTSDQLAYGTTPGDDVYLLEGDFIDGNVMYIVYGDFRQAIDKSLFKFEPTVIDHLRVTDLSGNSVSDLVLNENFELDLLKTKIKVYATYNDPDRPETELDADSYTLTRMGLNPATGKEDVLVEAGLGQETLFVLFKKNPIKRISKVTSLQGGTAIYSSASVESLKQYLEITVEYAVPGDPDANTVLTADQYTLTGVVNADGSYELRITVSGGKNVTYTDGSQSVVVSYDRCELTRDITSYDARKLLTITPVVPEDMRVTLRHTLVDGATQPAVFSGAAAHEVAALFKVEVRMNDSAEYVELAPAVVDENGVVITPAEYTTEGIFVIVGNTQDDNRLVTFRYTYNDVEVSAPGRYVLSPAVITSIEVRVQKTLPQVFYAELFPGNVGDPSLLWTILTMTGDSANRDLIVISHYSDNTEREMTDGDFDFVAFKAADGSALNAAKLDALCTSGGTIKVVVRYDVGQIDDDAHANDSKHQNFDKTFDLTIKAATPIKLVASRSKTDKLYTSTDLGDVYNWLTVTVVYDDGITTKVLDWSKSEDLNNFNLTTVSSITVDGVEVETSASMTVGGNVGLYMTYIYTGHGLIEGETSILVEFPELLSITASVATEGGNQKKKLYQWSSEATVCETLLVYAFFSDNDLLPVEVNAEDYSVSFDFNAEGLTIPGTAPVVVSYTANGITKTNTVNVTLSEAVIKSIKVDSSALASQAIYTSGKLDDLKTNGYIVVSVYRQGEDGEEEEVDIGTTTNYTLSLRDKDNTEQVVTWGDSGDFVVRVTYNNNTALTANFPLYVTEVAMYMRNVVFQQGDMAIYDDYQLDEIIDDVRAKIVINETWNDGLQRPGVYEFNITGIEAVSGVRNKLRVNYTHEKKGTLNPTARSEEITLVLTKTVITGISIAPKDEYQLFTSAYGTALTEKAAAATVLTLKHNSGKTAVANWADYEGYYSFTTNKNAWEAGGENVILTAKVEIDGKNYMGSCTVTVTPVVLSSISATWQQDAESLLFADATAVQVLSAGELTISGKNNDGSDYTGDIVITSDNLSFNFAVSSEVTVTYGELSCTFEVEITPVKLASLRIEKLKDLSDSTKDAKVYATTDIGDIVYYVKVYAVYNNGTEKVLSYNTDGVNGYKVVTGEGYGDLSLEENVSEHDNVITLQYTDEYENGKFETKQQTVTLHVMAAELQSISATYIQGSEKVYSYLGCETVRLSTGLTVHAVFKNGVDDSDIYDSVVTSGFVVLYRNAASEETDIPDADGVVQLVISYTYLGVTKECTVNVTITKKAINGIEVEWASMHRDIFSSTTAAQLVSNTDGGNALQKGELTLYKTFNDGSPREKIEGAVFGTDYTVSCDLRISNVVKVRYNYGEGLNATFEIDSDSIIPAQITSITADWTEAGKAGNLYTGNLPVITIQNMLQVVGKYNDDNTAVRDLGKNEYNVINYSASVVGEVTFTIVIYASGTISADTQSVQVTKLVKQLVSTSDFLPLEYRAKGAQASDPWAQVPEVGLFVGTPVDLRLPFKAKDSAGSTKYINVSDPTNWNVADSYHLILESINLEEGDSVDGVALYVLPQENPPTVTLVLSPKQVSGAPVITYEAFSTETIYTSTTLDELYMDVGSVKAKGQFVVTISWNDGSVEQTKYGNGMKTVFKDGVQQGDPAPMAAGENYPFSLGNSLTSGATNGIASITATYMYREGFADADLAKYDGETAFVSVGTKSAPVLVPQVLTISARVVETLTYGANESDIRNALEIKAETFNDDPDHQKPYVLNLNNAAELTYYYTEDRTQKFPGVPVNAGEYFVEVDISGISGYESIKEVVTGFSINPVQLSGSNIMAIADMEYTGAELKPVPVVVFDTVLVAGEDNDYTYTYENNVTVGKASVTITGKNNYKGTGVAYFNITPKLIEIPTLESKLLTDDAEINPLEPTLAASYSSVYTENYTVEGVTFTRILGAKVTDDKEVAANYKPMTAAGSYNIKLKLNDPDNYAWNGTSDKEIYVVFTITSEVAYFTNEEFTINGWTYGQKFNSPAGATAQWAEEDISSTIQYRYVAADGRAAENIPNSEYTNVYSATSHPTNAGTYYVKAYIPANGSAYAAVYSSVTKQLVIKKAPLTVKINSIADIKYGDPVPSYTVTYVGFVNGETSAVITGTLAFEGYSVGDNCGDYTITASGLENELNYAVTYTGATLHVGKVELVPTAAVESKEYNGNKVARGTITLTGAVRDEEPTATATFVWKNAAAGTTVFNVSDIALDEEWTTNYTLSTTELDNCTTEGQSITKRTATVIWELPEDEDGIPVLTYDAEKKVYTATYTGSEFDEPTATIQGITSDGILLVEVQMNNLYFKNADSYTFKAIRVLKNGIENKNYELENATLNVVIYKQTVNKPVVLDQTVDTEGNRQYSGLTTNSVYTVADDGRIGSGTQDAILTLRDTQNYKWDGEEDGVAQITIQYTIVEVLNEWANDRITWKLNDEDGQPNGATWEPLTTPWYYGEGDRQPLGARTVNATTYTYLVASWNQREDISAYIPYSEFVPNAGRYVIRVRAEAKPGEFGAIYTEAFEFEILPAEVHVSIKTPTPISYYDNVPAFELQFEEGYGLVNGDTLASLGIVPVFSGYSVGMDATEGSTDSSLANGYLITVAHFTNSNYTFVWSEDPVYLVVNKVELTPNASIKEKTYDAATNGEGKIELQGAVNSELPTATGVFTWASANAGETHFNVSEITLGEGWTTNYKVVNELNDVVSATSSIKPYEVEVNWTVADSYTYTGLVQTAPTATIVNVRDATVNLQVVISQPTGDGVTFKNVGKYTFTASLQDTNYTLKGTTQEVEIKPVELTITVNSSQVKFGDPLDPEVHLTYTVSGLVNNEEASAVIKGFVLSCPDYKVYDPANPAAATPIGATASINNTTPSADNYKITVINNAGITVISDENRFILEDGDEPEFKATDVTNPADPQTLTAENGIFTVSYGTVVEFSGFSAEKGTVVYRFASIEDEDVDPATVPENKYQNSARSVGLYLVKAYVAAAPNGAYVEIYSETCAMLRVTKVDISVVVEFEEGYDTVTYGSYMRQEKINVSYTGWKYNEDESNYSISFSGYTLGDGVKPDGEWYSITVVGLESDNYNFIITPAKLTVAPITLTASATINGKVFDGKTDGTGVVTVSGTYNGETVSVTEATFTWASAAAGETVFNVSGITLDGNPNYTVAATLSNCTSVDDENTPITISKATVALVWEYEATYTYTGSELAHPKAKFIDVEGNAHYVEVSLDGSFTNVGTYTFTAAFDSEDEQKDNYILTNTSLELSIGKKTINPPTVKTGIYVDEETPLQPFDDDYFTDKEYAYKAGAEYQFIEPNTTHTFYLTLNDPDNCQWATGFGTISGTKGEDIALSFFISQIIVNIDVTNMATEKSSYTYGEQTVAFSGATAHLDADEGFNWGDINRTPDVTYKYDTVANGPYANDFVAGMLLPAGTYYVKAFVAGTEYSGATYSETYQTIVVNPKALVVTINAPTASVVYGAALPEVGTEDYAKLFSVSYVADEENGIGFINGEDASVLTGSVVFTCQYTPYTTNVGNVVIEIATLPTSDNYTITWDNTSEVTFAVVPATITPDNVVSVAIADKDYDATTDGSGTISIVYDGTHAVDAEATFTWTNSAAGTRTFTVSGITLKAEGNFSTNYTLSGFAEGNSLADVQTVEASADGIRKALVTAIDWAVEDTYTYAGTILAKPTASFQGLGEDGTIELTVACTTTAGATVDFRDVRNYKFTATTTNENYTLDASKATITKAIVPAVLQLTISDVEVYNGTEASEVAALLSYTVEGLVGDDAGADPATIVNNLNLSVPTLRYNKIAAHGTKVPVLYQTPSADNYTIVVTNGTDVVYSGSFESLASIILIDKLLVIAGTPAVTDVEGVSVSEEDGLTTATWAYGVGTAIDAENGCTATITDKNGTAPFSGTIYYVFLPAGEGVDPASNELYSATLVDLGGNTVSFPKEVGTYYVKAKADADRNLGFSFDTYSENYLTVVITKAQVEIGISIVGGNTHHYGDVVEYTYVVPTLPYSEADSTVTSGLSVAGYTPGDAVNAEGETYSITISGETELTSYVLSFTGAELTILPKPLTISGITAADKKYDATITASLDLSGMVVNGLFGEEVVLVDVTGEFADPNANDDEPQTLVMTYAFAEGQSESLLANYVLAEASEHAAVQAKILKREITITVYGREVLAGAAVKDVTFGSYMVVDGGYQGTDEKHMDTEKTVFSGATLQYYLLDASGAEVAYATTMPAGTELTIGARYVKDGGTFQPTNYKVVCDVETDAKATLKIVDSFPGFILAANSKLTFNTIYATSKGVQQSKLVIQDPTKINWETDDIYISGFTKYALGLTVKQVKELFANGYAITARKPGATKDLAATAKVGHGTVLTLTDGDKTYHATVILPGDLNGDGLINLKDRTEFLTYANSSAKFKAADIITRLAVDLNQDNLCNLKDRTAFLNHYNKIDLLYAG